MYLHMICTFIQRVYKLNHIFIIFQQSNDLRNVAAEGLAKLLLSGRVLSAKLLSRLILLWYNPTTEEDGSLRHCIGVFLPVFAFASR
jgi:condensin complex subunit 3